MVAIVLLLAFVVVADKKHFGGMVGSYFLQTMFGGLFLGALILLVASWRLHERRNWRGRTLIAWALIALTSPLFGWMFIMPWMVLALTLPLVIAALVSLWREREASAGPW